MSEAQIDPILLHRWHPVGWSQALQEGQVVAARLLGQELVLWRSEGQAHAWRDLCVHRGTRLSLGRVAQQRLICAYHGWQYGPHGGCVHIPAHPRQATPEKARATTYSCCESGGILWASLGTPTSAPPSLEPWKEPGSRHIYCGPYSFQASAPRVVENFLDVAHFPFVHDGLLGDSQHPEVELEDYQVTVSEQGLVAQDIEVYQPNPDGSGRGGKVRYTYRVLAPFQADLTKDINDQRFHLFLAVSPQDERSSLAFMLITMNYAHDVPEAELRNFQDLVVSQDRPIVESQRPELLPLDLQAELHLRSDRAALAYRRWLKTIGLSFGTQ